MVKPQQCIRTFNWSVGRQKKGPLKTTRQFDFPSDFANSHITWRSQRSQRDRLEAESTVGHSLAAIVPNHGGVAFARTTPLENEYIIGSRSEPLFRVSVVGNNHARAIRVHMSDA